MLKSTNGFRVGAPFLYLMRLDIYMVEKGLVASREKAKHLIQNGLVCVNDVVVTKPSKLVTSMDAVAIAEEFKYVSRAGYKLAAAIEQFQIDFLDKVIVDIGCSTGGFTDCALQHGAKKVYAVDIGDPLHPNLRVDPRVFYLPNVDARTLESLQEAADIVLVDVTFASLPEILERSSYWMPCGGTIISLVKPPYEIGGRARKVKGVAECQEIVDNVVAWSQEHGFLSKGCMESPLTGKTAGQREYLLVLKLKYEGVDKND